MYNKDQLDQALNLLAKILESENANPFHMVVCGGSSLILTGLVTRTTRDVDVLGFIIKEKDGLYIQSSKPSKKEIEMAVKWALSQDPSIAFRNTLKEMLRVLHYEFIARKI